MITLIASDTLPGGKHWSMMMWRNSRLKLTDIEGGANVGMLFYNPLNLLERYNAPDTLKCQHTFKLTQGHCLYSDMGRIFCSIVADSFGWHDTVCGNTTKASVARKWGETNYQNDRNDWQQNGTTASWSKRRNTASAGVIFPPTSTGSAKSWWLKTAPCRSTRARRRRRAPVELRFEMDTLVLFIPARTR